VCAALAQAGGSQKSLFLDEGEEVEGEVELEGLEAVVLVAAVASVLVHLARILPEVQEALDGLLDTLEVLLLERYAHAHDTQSAKLWNREVIARCAYSGTH